MFSLSLENKIKQLQKKYEPKLLSFPNVVGVGIGFKERKNVSTKKLCLKVYVLKKIPPSKLSKDQLIPKRLEGIETDVEEAGRLKAQ